jgi:hypothetical protein
MRVKALQSGVFACQGAAPGAPETGAGRALVASAEPIPRTARRRFALPASDPHYDAATDTYRQIYRAHDNASAVTNSDGITVYFDPDTHEVLGFAIARFRAYYEAHKTPEGDFDVNLPTRVPANLEEEMDFDAEAIRSGVRIAEFY